MALDKIHADMIRIYALIDPFDGMTRYVGKTVGTLRARLNGHLGDVRRGRVYIPRHKWILSVIQRGGTPEIVELDLCREADWKETEQFWISYLRFIGCPLLNATAGGDGLSQFQHRAQTKERQSLSASKRYADPKNRAITGNAVRAAYQRDDAKANLLAAAKVRKRDASDLVAEAKSETGRARRSKMAAGRKQTEAAKEKIRQAAIGRKWPEASRAKFSKFRTGKRHSPETIEKMRRTWARKHST